MAPLLQSYETSVKRDIVVVVNNNDDDKQYCDWGCSSAWNKWGRWVLLGVIIAIALALPVVWLIKRRRIQRGLSALRGSTWDKMREEFQQTEPPTYYINGPNDQYSLQVTPGYTFPPRSPPGYSPAQKTGNYSEVPRHKKKNIKHVLTPELIDK